MQTPFDLLTNPMTIRIGLGASLLLFVVAAAFARSAEDTIRKNFSETSITSIKQTPISGLYEVKTDNTVFYSDNSGRYVVFGHLYDVERRQDLTPTLAASNVEKAHERQIDLRELPTKAAIEQGPKDGPSVSIFIDPDCPYCKQLIRDLANQQVLHLSYYLMPLGALHPNAMVKSQGILCSQDPYHALLRVATGQASLNNTTCDTSALPTIVQFGKAHQFYGTPILIRADGHIHMGYLPREDVIAWAQAGENRP